MLLSIIVLTSSCDNFSKGKIEKKNKEEKENEEITEESSKRLFPTAPEYYSDRGITIYEDLVFARYKPNDKEEFIRIEGGNVTVIKKVKEGFTQYLSDGKIYCNTHNKNQFIYDIQNDNIIEKRFYPKGTYLEDIINGKVFYVKDGISDGHNGWDFYYNKKRILRGVGDAYAVTKDAIYYVDFDWHREKYKYDTIKYYDLKTKDKKKLLKTEFLFTEAKKREKEWDYYLINNIKVFDDYIVYTVAIAGMKDKYNETRIYVYNTVTGVNEMIDCPINDYLAFIYFTYCQGNIYFECRESIYKYDTINGELTTITSELRRPETFAYIFVFDNEYVYLLFNDSTDYPAGFYRIPCNGGELEPYFIFE